VAGGTQHLGEGEVLGIASSESRGGKTQKYWGTSKKPPLLKTRKTANRENFDQKKHWHSGLKTEETLSVHGKDPGKKKGKESVKPKKSRYARGGRGGTRIRSEAEGR